VPDERSLPLNAVHLAGVNQASRQAAAKAAAEENEKDVQARKVPADPGPAKAVQPVSPSPSRRAARALEVPRGKRPKKKAPKAPPPPDPHGRGSSVDVKA
jgi:hypothetical protein